MDLEHSQLLAFKQLPLPDLLAGWGIALKPRGEASHVGLCPFHEDSTPSLSVTQKGDVWLWRCFGCNAGGTVIDFVMKRERLSLPEACRRLKELLPPEKQEVISINPLELLKSAVELYHKSFYEDPRGMDYLKARGIRSTETHSSFRIGFSNGTLKKSLPTKGPIPASLRNIGLLNPDGSEFFSDCVVIPLLDEDGNVTGLYGRSIRHKKHLYLKGPHKGLVNRQGAYGTKLLILTESILDALSLYELGIRNVIPLYGTGGFTRCHAELLKKSVVEELDIAFDNDDAGRHGAEDLAAKLQMKTRIMKLPDGTKDLNDFLVSGKGKDDYLALEGTEVVQAPVLNLEPAGIIVQKDKDTLNVSIKDRSYRILLPERDSIHNLRVNIKITQGDTRHIDVVDLYSDRARHLYAKKTAKLLLAPDHEIESDLLLILDEIEKHSLKPEDASPGEFILTEEEKQEALTALKSPTLAKDIARDLETIGCVGEDSPKLLGYVITLSRKLEQPLSMIIVSQSGAGKSNLADTLESVIPEDECVHLSRITPQALYYMGKTELKNKVLIIEEKEGSSQADYSLRVLQSKKRLKLAVPMKDPQTGKIKTTTFEVEGPLSVIETTTRLDVNPENASRCYIVYLDESEDQTRRIHEHQKRQKTLKGLEDKQSTDRLRKKHRAIQKILKPLNVHIPYIDQIHFPSKWMRTRRDHMKFLNLIEAVAFLHQYQRPVKTTHDIEYIEATHSDYALAYEMSKDIFGDCLSELTKPDKDFLELVRQMTGDQKQDRFTRRMIREHSGLPDHLIRGSLDRLIGLEYLLIDGGKNGIQFEYRLNPQISVSGREIIRGLTTPDELKRHLAATLREPCSKVNPIKLNGLKVPCNLAG